jgi:nicotinamidase-related amidase
LCQWGAFHGTELDLQLRRRGIQTIVLGGLATNIGVESTARQAWEHGYAILLVEDATSSLSRELHDFAVKNIFPRLSCIVKAADIGF